VFSIIIRLIKYKKLINLNVFSFHLIQNNYIGKLVEDICLKGFG